MDAIKKKVISDIFGHPLVVWPGTAGVTALLLSAVFMSPILAGLGVMACLASGGMLATNLLLNLEKITKNAYDFQKQEELKELQKKINVLYLELGDNGKAALNKIAAARRSIRINIEQGIIRGGDALLDKANMMFDVCVKNLQNCRDIGKALKKLNGKAKKEAEKDYGRLIDDVNAAADQLSDAEQKYIAMSAKKDSAQLDALRAELDQSLKVAEAVDARLNGQEKKNYDIEKFRKKQPREEID